MENSYNVKSVAQFLYQKVENLRLLTKEEEIELSNKAKAGCDESRVKMVHHNIRLCFKLANVYKTPSIPLEDLVQEGVKGLDKAVMKFEGGERGVRFATYARWWIKQKMILYSSKHRTNVRIPHNKLLAAYVIRKFEEKYALENQGDKPSIQEIADNTPYTPGRIKKCQDLVYFGEESLDAGIHEDQEDSVYSKIPDDEAENAPDTISRREDIISIRECVQFLDWREALIITERFGLDGRGKRTLKEISAELNLSRERIRQIEELVIAKMRRWLKNEKRI